MYNAHICTIIFTVYVAIAVVYVSVSCTCFAKISIRDPFSEKSPLEKSMTLRQSKRTQRYRSTAKSRILGMTVGDIRYCFQQLRAAGDTLTPYFILYNGLYAGEFTLMYLIETSNSMKKRRRKRKNEEETEDGESNDESPTGTLPMSQLVPKRPKKDEHVCIRTMEF